MPDDPPVRPEILRLRKAVQDAAISQVQIAERSGLTQSMVSLVLSGKKDPAVSTVARVLAAIGYRWADLDEPG